MQTYFPHLFHIIAAYPANSDVNEGEKRLQNLQEVAAISWAYFAEVRPGLEVNTCGGDLTLEHAVMLPKYAQKNTRAGRAQAQNIAAV